MYHIFEFYTKTFQSTVKIRESVHKFHRTMDILIIISFDCFCRPCALQLHFVHIHALTVMLNSECQHCAELFPGSIKKDLHPGSRIIEYWNRDQDFAVTFIVFNLRLGFRVHNEFLHLPVPKLQTLRIS